MTLFPIPKYKLKKKFMYNASSKKWTKQPIHQNPNFKNKTMYNSWQRVVIPTSKVWIVLFLWRRTLKRSKQTLRHGTIQSHSQILDPTKRGQIRLTDLQIGENFKGLEVEPRGRGWMIWKTCPSKYRIAYHFLHSSSCIPI